MTSYKWFLYILPVCFPFSFLFSYTEPYNSYTTFTLWCWGSCMLTISQWLNWRCSTQPMLQPSLFSPIIQDTEFNRTSIPGQFLLAVSPLWVIGLITVTWENIREAFSDPQGDECRGRLLTQHVLLYVRVCLRVRVGYNIVSERVLISLSLGSVSYGSEGCNLWSLLTHHCLTVGRIKWYLSLLSFLPLSKTEFPVSGMLLFHRKACQV